MADIESEPADRLTQREFATLIRISGQAGRGAVEADFGPGGVWLHRRHDGHVASAWAVPLLEQLRGEAFDDGDGI